MFSPGVPVEVEALLSQATVNSHKANYRVIIRLKINLVTKLDRENKAAIVPTFYRCF